MKSGTVTPLIGPSYLAAIRNSVGTRLFRNFYAEVDGKRRDVMRDGDLSCAFFVSSVLVMFGLLKKVHATVKCTVADLEKSGWQSVRVPRAGDVLVWEPVIDERGESHAHIGFALGNGMAISNASAPGVPERHSVTFGTRGGKPRRRIEAIYRKKA
jgi:hypothetical protein